MYGPGRRGGIGRPRFTPVDHTGEGGNTLVRIGNGKGIQLEPGRLPGVG